MKNEEMCVKNEGFVFKMMNFADGDAVWWRVRHFRYKFIIYNAKCITFNAKLITLNTKFRFTSTSCPKCGKECVNILYYK